MRNVILSITLYYFKYICLATSICFVKATYVSSYINRINIRFLGNRNSAKTAYYSEIFIRAIHYDSLNMPWKCNLLSNFKCIQNKSDKFIFLILTNTPWSYVSVTWVLSTQETESVRRGQIWDKAFWFSFRANAL